MKSPKSIQPSISHPATHTSALQNSLAIDEKGTNNVKKKLLGQPINFRAHQECMCLMIRKGQAAQKEYRAVELKFWVNDQV